MRPLLLAIAILFYINTAYSDYKIHERKITMPIDIISTGGAGISCYDKFGMLFMNPASYALSDQPKFSILQTGLRANIGLFDYYQLFKSGFDINSLTPAQWKTLLTLNANIGVNGPLALGYVWDGIGVLLYNDTMVYTAAKQGPGLPYFDFGTYSDIGFLIGFGFKIPMPVIFSKYAKAYGGITVKYLNRMKYENPRMSLFELMDFGMNVMNFKFGFDWGQAIGSDLGFLVKSEEWSGGIVIRDWFSTQFSWAEYNQDFSPSSSGKAIANTYYMPSFDLGGSYRFKNLMDKTVMSDLTLYLDLVNIADWQENFFLKTRVGAEVTLFTILKLRGGLYKGYPTAGFGLVFPIISIDGAYYTEELGELPGALPQENYELQVHLVL